MSLKAVDRPSRSTLCLTAPGLLPRPGAGMPLVVVHAICIYRHLSSQSLSTLDDVSYQLAGILWGRRIEAGAALGHEAGNVVRLNQ
jgi:hypothetical protein